MTDPIYHIHVHVFENNRKYTDMIFRVFVDIFGEENHFYNNYMKGKANVVLLSKSSKYRKIWRISLRTFLTLFPN